MIVYTWMNNRHPPVYRRQLQCLHRLIEKRFSAILQQRLGPPHALRFSRREDYPTGGKPLIPYRQLLRTFKKMEIACPPRTLHSSYKQPPAEESQTKKNLENSLKSSSSVSQYGANFSEFLGCPIKIGLSHGETVCQYRDGTGVSSVNNYGTHHGSKATECKKID